ncbi:MAG: prepilin peptidase [Clostridia bacterium]|nr:prepilin peptidase [Clostridia bacterium]
MNIFLYIIIFIMGTLFGSFYTLAVYRIPRKIDIIYTHSFCPNCGHKLGFWELIPVWSYLLLGGKCKKCNKKIRPRYFVLEILSGLVFISIAYALKIDAYNLQCSSLIRFAFIALYLVCIFIIAGIDKDERRIEKSVLYYGIMVSCAYIIYLCIMGQTSIYRYVMYLVTLIVLLILDTEYQITKAKQSYYLENLMLIIVMIVNSTEFVTIASIIVVFLSIILTKIIYYLKNSLNKHKKEHKDLKQIHKFAYLLTIANIILLIGQMRLYYL